MVYYGAKYRSPIGDGGLQGTQPRESLLELVCLYQDQLIYTTHPAHACIRLAPILTGSFRKPESCPPFSFVSDVCFYLKNLTELFFFLEKWVMFPQVGRGTEVPL